MAPDAEICLSFIFYISALKLNTWLAITLRNKCHQTVRGRILKSPFQVYGFENWRSLQVWISCILWIPNCHLMLLWFLEFHLVKHLYTSVKYLLLRDLFSQLSSNQKWQWISSTFPKEVLSFSYSSFFPQNIEYWHVIFCRPPR